MRNDCWKVGAGWIGQDLDPPLWRDSSPRPWLSGFALPQAPSIVEKMENRLFMQHLKEGGV